jgi:hypothetical protein
MMNLTVGQIVYVREARRGGGLQSVRVTKIGRKWITLGDNRYRLEVGKRILDGKGYSSPGTVYLSEDQFHGELAIDKAWSKFKYAMGCNHAPPTGVTVGAIEQAMQLLCINSHDS